MGLVNVPTVAYIHELNRIAAEIAVMPASQYSILAASIFSIVAVLQLARAIFGAEVKFGTA
jgi:hypothetical protein